GRISAQEEEQLRVGITKTPLSAPIGGIARGGCRDYRNEGRIIMTSRDGQLIVAVCPGLVDTRASRPRFTDMSAAESRDQAAVDIVSLAPDPVAREMSGELVQHGRILSWRAASEAAERR